MESARNAKEPTPTDSKRAGKVLAESQKVEKQRAKEMIYPSKTYNFNFTGENNEIVITL